MDMEKGLRCLKEEAKTKGQRESTRWEEKGKIEA